MTKRIREHYASLFRDPLSKHGLVIAVSSREKCGLAHVLMLCMIRLEFEHRQG